MARALRYEQMTPADELRERLAACEKGIANLRGSGTRARALLEDMDRIGELWPVLEAAGLDLRPEAGRWETIQASVKRVARRLLKELRASGGLATVRAEQHPDGQCAWWWRLDEAVAQDSKRRALRTSLTVATIIVAVLAAYFLFRLLFPVDPNLKAAMDLQSAGEMKIQKAGDFAGALADFRSATSFLPNDAETWLRLGVAQEVVGDQSGDGGKLRSGAGTDSQRLGLPVHPRQRLFHAGPDGQSSTRRRGKRRRRPREPVRPLPAVFHLRNARADAGRLGVRTARGGAGRSARTDAVVRHGALSHGDDDATGATAGIRLALADRNPAP